MTGAPRLAALALAGSLLGACSTGAETSRPAPSRTPTAEGSTGQTAPSRTTTTPPTTPTTTPPPTPTRTAQPGPEPSDGRPRQATLTVPRIGLREMAVVPYRGFTDDAPGTRIQDGGVLASPHGPRGGVGPGGIGNFQVTGHRLSSTRAFLRLPELRRGDRVHVETADRRWTYRIVGTRETSFRSPASLRAQRAAVPGRPGARPTQAMITLSTCATPEDRAAGNFWSDRFGNPEHRIDKIGVLVSSRPA